MTDDDISRTQRKPVSLPRVSIQQQSSIERLKQHKLDARTKAINTLENNKPRLDAIIVGLQTDKYPGVVSYTYVRGSYTLTVRYVAMMVQWFAHKDELYVREGNDRGKKSLCDIGVFEYRLKQGRRSFQ